MQRVVRGTTYNNHKMKTGTELIAEERARQISGEGWLAEHDDTHDRAEMNNAARAYAEVAAFQARGGKNVNKECPPNGWPWSIEWYKPADEPIRNLVKAGALIAAEIDRLQRASNVPN